MVRILMAAMVALLLAVPASAQFVTKRFTFYGCSQWACHTAKFELIGTGPGFNRVLEVYQYSVVSRYKKSAGIPLLYGFADAPGLFPLLNGIPSPVANQHFLREIIEPFLIMIWPGRRDSPERFRPTTMFVEEVLGPNGTFFGAVNGDYVGRTTLHLVSEESAFESALHVTPEPVSLVLLGTGLAGIAGAAARRKRKHASEP